MREKQTVNAFLLLTLISLLLLTSCSVIGNVYEHENIDKLEEGMTVQEVTSILGAKPLARTNLENGDYRLMWKYGYGTALATSGARSVRILFSSDDKMIRIVQTSEVGKPL